MKNLHLPLILLLALSAMCNAQNNFYVGLGAGAFTPGGMEKFELFLTDNQGQPDYYSINFHLNQGQQVAFQLGHSAKKWSWEVEFANRSLFNGLIENNGLNHRIFPTSGSEGSNYSSTTYNTQTKSVNFKTRYYFKKKKVTSYVEPTINLSITDLHHFTVVQSGNSLALVLFQLNKDLSIGHTLHMGIETQVNQRIEIYAQGGYTLLFFTPRELNIDITTVDQNKNTITTKLSEKHLQLNERNSSQQLSNTFLNASIGIRYNFKI